VEIAEKIKEARRYASPALTQEGLAKLVGRSRALIARWENGTSIPKSVDLVPLAERLRIDVRWFFDGKEGPPPISDEDLRHVYMAAYRNSPGFPEYKGAIEEHVGTKGGGRGQAHGDELIELSFESLPRELQSLVRGDKVVLPLWRGVLGSPEGECEFLEPDSPEWVEIPAFLAGRDYHNCRVCKVAGMSMAPRIRQGDQVVVRLESNPSPGMIVVVERPDHGGKLIKVLRETPDGELELHSIGKDFGVVPALDGMTCIAVATGIWSDTQGAANIEWNGGAPLRA
jgi:transcriptional regulator with XRE-family HTH domain